jgi:hypothetical protein
MVQSDLTRIQQIRLQGHPHLAISWADQLSDHLRAVIADSLPSAARDQLLSLLAQLLGEKAAAFTRTLLPQAIEVRTRPIVQELETIAETVGSPALHGLAKFVWANALYNVKNFPACITVMNEAFDALHADPICELHMLRTLVISHGHLGHDSQTDRLGRRITTCIESGRVDDIDAACETCEGLARAQGQLGLSRAVTTLEQARGIYKQLPRDRGRNVQAEIQLERTEAEILLLIDPRERLSIEHCVERGGRLAREFAYEKYVEQFQALESRLADASGGDAVARS